MNMSNHALLRLQQRISCVAPTGKYDRFNFLYDMKYGSILSAQQTKDKRWKMEVSLPLCSWLQHPLHIRLILILCPDMKTIITLWISSIK
jgi:hypothetical protein